MSFNVIFAGPKLSDEQCLSQKLMQIRVIILLFDSVVTLVQGKGVDSISN